MSDLSVITLFKVRSNSVVFYPSFELYPTNRGYDSKSQENLLDNRVKGYLSVASSRKIRDLVENWVNACKADQLRTKKSLDKYLCFVTLTLPAEQRHPDKVIKRECLNKFLIYAKRKFGVKNYLWKAEPQKNGNVHFHLIMDRFLPWQDVRKVWNECVESLGYIEDFTRKHGHSDPNSSDVHGLKRDKKGNEILFVGAYLAKYMSKKASEKDGVDRPLEGRIWGCSDGLKLLTAFRDYDSDYVDRFYQSLKDHTGIVEYSGEFFRVFVGKWMETAKENPDLMRKIDLFYLDQYRKINDLTETE